MNIMIIGSGGREHALAWKLAQSAQVSEVYVAPGNGGTDPSAPEMRYAVASVSNLPDLLPTDTEGIISFCKNKKV